MLKILVHDDLVVHFDNYKVIADVISFYKGDFKVASVKNKIVYKIEEHSDDQLEFYKLKNKGE